MVAAMEHASEAETVAYHGRIEAIVFAEWEALDADPDVAEWDEQERKNIDRFAKQCMAEDATKCLNERT